MRDSDEILIDLNSQIDLQAEETKASHRVGSPALRNSLIFSLKKCKEMTPKGYSFKLSTQVSLSDNSDITDFSIDVEFKRGR